MMLDRLLAKYCIYIFEPLSKVNQHESSRNFICIEIISICVSTYIKIKFNSDEDLSLNKTIEIHNVTIVVMTVFHENNKYYSHVFLDECLYEI